MFSIINIKVIIINNQRTTWLAEKVFSFHLKMDKNRHMSAGALSMPGATANINTKIFINLVEM